MQKFGQCFPEPIEQGIEMLHGLVDGKHSMLAGHDWGTPARNVPPVGNYSIFGSQDYEYFEMAKGFDDLQLALPLNSDCGQWVQLAGSKGNYSVVIG